MKIVNVLLLQKNNLELKPDTPKKDILKDKLIF